MNVLTYRLKIEESTKEAQDWIAKCNSKTGLFIAKISGRFYVYCNTIPKNYDFTYSIETDDGRDNLTIKPDNYITGNGYALLSAPISDSLTATCEEYSETISND